MSIVIKEIILSDTLEKFMEKVNFNFDQLMLAGGGPPGPIGPMGLPGPAGPKGDPGNKWYVGCTGTEIAIGTTLYEGDLFLQNECGASGASYGDVFEWNNLTNQFDATGLNIIGPQGPPGTAGANLFGGIYPGETFGVVYQATSEDVPGPTANFYLLKGDTDYPGLVFGGGDPNANVAGITSKNSRDILWLGGLEIAQTIQNTTWPLELMPKLFVAPRSNYKIDNYTGPTATRAGNGISIGNDSLNQLFPLQAQSQMWANIFRDDLYNLRITNWSDFDLAAGGTYQNSISLESTSNVRLMSGRGPLPSMSSQHSFDLGKSSALSAYYGLDYQVFAGGTPTVFDAGGAILSSTAADSLIAIQSGANSITKIHGGGNKDYPFGPLKYPNLVFGSTSGVSNLADGKWTAIIDTQSEINDDQGFSGRNKLVTSLQKGHRAGAVETQSYFGIGHGIGMITLLTHPAPSYNTSFHVVGEQYEISNAAAQVVGRGTQIGTESQIDASWHQSYDLSLDVVGRIRMRNSATTSNQVIISDDATGTMVWADSTEVGVWIEDTGCSSRIVLADNRFASTVNNGVNEGYSRFDIAMNTETPNASNRADLVFVNYNDTILPPTDPGDSDYATYSMSLTHDDDESQGQLSLSVYSNAEGCQSDLSQSTLSGEIRIQTWDKSGRIRIAGSGVSNSIGLENAPGQFDRIFIKSSANFMQDTVSRVRSNIYLSNSGSDDLFASPLIKFSTLGQSTPGNNYMDDETNIEILRSWAGNAGGQHNIRFKGTGRSPNPTIPTAPADTTQQQVASGGAHVLMISDQEDAVARDGNLENTNDYYELDHTEMFVDRMRLTYSSTPTSNGLTEADALVKHISNNFTLYKWGTASSGWNTGGGTIFNGSRAIGGLQGNYKTPARSKHSPAPFITTGTGSASNIGRLCVENALYGGSSNFNNIIDTDGYASNLNVWNSPTSSFRYQPINLSTGNNQGDDQTGVAMVNFNLDIGIVIETDEIGGDAPLVVSAPKYYGALCGPGTLSGAAGNVLSGRSSPNVGMEDQMRLQSFRMRLDSKAIEGLGAMLSEFGTKNPARNRNPYNPGVPAAEFGSLRNNAHFHTDWLPGVCRAMWSGLKANNITSGALANVIHPDASGSVLNNQLQQSSWTNNATNPAQGDTMNMFGPAATGAPASGLPMTDPGSNSGIGIVADHYADTAPKWQNANIQWRLETDYLGVSQTNDFDAAIIPTTYIHIMYSMGSIDNSAQQKITGATGGLPSFYAFDLEPIATDGNAGPWFGQAAPSDWGSPQRYLTNFPGSRVNSPDGSGNAPTNSGNFSSSGYDMSFARQDFALQMMNGFGIPINYLLLPQEWQGPNAGKTATLMNLERLLRYHQRKNPFYQSHGLGFSGSGMVRWNNSPRFTTGTGGGSSSTKSALTEWVEEPTNEGSFSGEDTVKETIQKQINNNKQA